MAVKDLKAEKRTDLSGSAVKTNRKNGNIPGIFYKGKENIPIYVKEVNLRQFVFTSEARLINLLLEGTDMSYNCIMRDVQYDPVSDRPIHFDLLGISQDEKIKISVPVQLVGAAAGVKDGGIIQFSVRELEIECLPKDIPSHIDIDISGLQIGYNIHVSDLKTENYIIHDNPDIVIVSVLAPVVEKAEETSAVEGETVAAEPEVITKGKKEEVGEEEKK